MKAVVAAAYWLACVISSTIVHSLFSFLLTLFLFRLAASSLTDLFSATELPRELVAGLAVKVGGNEAGPLTPLSVDSSKASPESGVFPADVFGLDPSLSKANSPEIQITKIVKISKKHKWWIVVFKNVKSVPDLRSVAILQGLGFGAFIGWVVLFLMWLVSELPLISDFKIGDLAWSDDALLKFDPFVGLRKSNAVDLNLTDEVADLSSTFFVFLSSASLFSSTDVSCVRISFLREEPSVVLRRANGDAVSGESPCDLRPIRGEHFSKLSLERDRGAGSSSVFKIGELHPCFLSASDDDGGMLLWLVNERLGLPSVGKVCNEL